MAKAYCVDLAGLDIFKKTRFVVGLAATMGIVRFVRFNPVRTAATKQAAAQDPTRFTRDRLHNLWCSVIGQSQAVCYVVFLVNLGNLDNSPLLTAKRRLAAHPDLLGKSSPELCKGPLARIHGCQSDRWAVSPPMFQRRGHHAEKPL